jgi:hypothetical protein
MPTGPCFRRFGFGLLVATSASTISAASAATSTATAPATSASTAKAPTTRAAAAPRTAAGTRAGLINLDGLTLQIRAVSIFYCRLGLIFRWHFYESESFGFTGKLVLYNVDRFNLAECLKYFTQILIVYVVCQITYIDVHFALLMRYVPFGEWEKIPRLQAVVVDFAGRWLCYHKACLRYQFIFWPQLYHCLLHEQALYLFHEKLFSTTLVTYEPRATSHEPRVTMHE